MTFKEYQDKAWETALPTAQNIGYLGLGLANEAGEVAGKIKKTFRGDSVSTDEIRKEIGDVLWYCACLATQLKLDLGLIASANLIKLQDRKARGVLQGNGDTR